ncbi:hypothetical protein JMJ35_010036 [Cladonia borealis]|uniref:Uncharacterized protein n=1 Tax=Cladonia borealis TaxID=184061 RepID=A0AA39QQX5_9LECA|nr:hypothetical protein JMJ35_010036 [Cladonia borealis]
MTPVDLGRNAISKRIKAARIQAGEEIPQCECRKWKAFAGEGIPLDEHEVRSHPETEQEDSQAFRINNARARELEDVREHEVSSQPETELEDSHAFRMNSTRTTELEDVRQSDRLRKRRKLDG